MANLKITLVKSAIASKPKHKLTLQALGLGGTGSSYNKKFKINKSVVHADTPAVRGQIHQVSHLLKVEEVQ